MTFSEQEPDINKTATLTVRNIPLDVDAMITVQASLAGKSKSDFLKELLTQEFQDLIKNFSRTSPLVGLMDEELGKQFGVEVASHWFENEMITSNNHRYKALLNLTTHDDLQQIMMRNMPCLQLRASQELLTLPPSSRNRLYVACSRARGNIYFVPESHLRRFRN